jgi:hypothetical protein
MLWSQVEKIFWSHFIGGHNSKAITNFTACALDEDCNGSWNLFLKDAIMVLHGSCLMRGLYDTCSVQLNRFWR